MKRRICQQPHKEPGNWNIPYVPFWRALASDEDVSAKEAAALSRLFRSVLGTTDLGKDALDYLQPTAPAKPTETGKILHHIFNGVPE